MKPCHNCGTGHATNGPYCPDCEFMSPAEAQKRLHISPATWYRWLNDGKITSRKVGPRKRLIPRAEVEAMLSV